MTYWVPVPEGAVTVSSDDERTRTPVASLPPKRTETVPRKLVPVMVSFVPPLAGPLPAEILVIVGLGT